MSATTAPSPPKLRPRSSRGVARPRPASGHRPVPATQARFRDLDRYRVEREWLRYEGTPQRDLFRELRARFLERHRDRQGWSLDLGSGPGRFAPYIGAGDATTVLVDLSLEMLRFAHEVAPGPRAPSLVRADALAPPFRPAAFTAVVALGNPLGFAGGLAEKLLDHASRLVRPGGVLLLEAVAGPGESSTYLRRLPPSAVARLLAAPLNLVRSRLLREGFRSGVPRKEETGEFRRFSPDELARALAARGFKVEERLAVAPCLGGDPERVAAVRPDGHAWRNLLELEETVGRLPDRWPRAAAWLVAARRADVPRADASD